MNEFTIGQIMERCALGSECRCTTASKPWTCENWARSMLAAPRIGHTESHYTGKSRSAVIAELDARKRKNDKWNTETEKRLREVRHADPRKHLRKKGVKI